MSRFLPVDIIENILTRLPVKSISRFRCVSKNWYHLFRNPNFIKNHLNHANLMNRFNILVTDDAGADDINTNPCLYYVDNNVLSSSSSPFLGHALNIDYPFMTREHVPQVLGSCDGLVCIEPFPDSSICIWNPATREYKQVPEPDWEYYFMAHGFGFDCKNDDYKVLGIESYGEGEISDASVYSLASDSWKELGMIPYNFSSVINKGFRVNGVLHWIATDPRAGLESKVIVCYDISDETFHDVSIPTKNPKEIGNGRLMSELGVWEGKLCLLGMNRMEDPDVCTHIDVWTMMDNKWSKHLKITANMADMCYQWPIQTLQNGEILFEGGPRGWEVVSGLISYDPKLERARALKIHGFPFESDVEIYIETLVALNSGTYVGQ